MRDFAIYMAWTLGLSAPVIAAIHGCVWLIGGAIPAAVSGLLGVMVGAAAGCFALTRLS